MGDNPLRSQFNYTIENGQRTHLEETFYFDDDGLSTTPDIAKTITYDWDYDTNDRLISETIDHHDDALDRTEHFVMDLFGNRLSRTVDYVDPTINDQFFEYTYDDNDRLISETLDTGNDGTVDQTTTYDWGQDDTVTPALLGGTQQLGKTVTDSSSNTISTQTFSYNLQGRLAEVVKEDYTSGSVTARTRVQYAYDSSGIRIRATEADDANLNGTFEASEEGNTTEYLIDPGNHTGYAQTIVETTKDSGDVITKRIAYTFGTDEITQTVTDYVAGVAQTPKVHTFGHDAHGSVRVLLDAAGAIAQAYTYAAYGELLAIHNATGASVTDANAPGLADDALTSLLYSGESFDSRIGQQYLRARWYDASVGRFSRLDPYFGNLQDPLSFNKFNYVHSNPIAGNDPTGLSTLGNISISIGLGTTIAGSTLGAVQAVQGYASGEFTAGQALGVWAKWSLVSAGLGLAGGLGVFFAPAVGAAASAHTLVSSFAVISGLVSVPLAVWSAADGGTTRDGIEALASGLNQVIPPWPQAAARNYEREIKDSATRHGIPAELLASILTAERLDFNVFDSFFDNSNYGEGFAKHSIGLAQLRIDNMAKWDIRGWNDSTPHWQIRRALSNHGQSIEVLAEVLARMVDKAPPALNYIQAQLSNWDNLSYRQREELVWHFAASKDTGSLNNVRGELSGTAKEAFRLVRRLGSFSTTPSS